MKKYLTALVLLFGLVSVVFADAKTELIKKVDSWFAEAKPTTKIVWLTDARGCLVSAFDDGKGIKLVQILDEQKQPICRKAK